MTSMVKRVGATAVVVSLVLSAATPIAAQSVRGSRRGAVAKDGDGHGAAVGQHGAAVKGEEGYAAAGRHGAVVKGDEGYAAVGRHGAVAKGDDGDAAVGRRGAVVMGEEGAAAVGRHGNVVVGNRYESYEGWKLAAGAGAAIAIGTVLARPPTAAATVAVGGSSYWSHDNVYYTRVISGGAVTYQVVAPPAGAIITVLPAHCTTVQVGGQAYSQCGSTHYQRVGNGYQVVVLQ